MEMEMPAESTTGENQIDSTPPAGISGELEQSIATTKTPCQQSKPFNDAEKSINPIESSNIQEQDSAISAEKTDSFRRSLFEPKENSTPKSTNVSSVGEQNIKPFEAGVTVHPVSDR